MARAIGRPIDAVVFNTAQAVGETALARYRAEHKQPLELGDMPRVRSRTGRFLVRRNRAPRPAAARAGGLGGAGAPAVVVPVPLPVR